jgi:hypothetical protein
MIDLPTGKMVGVKYNLKIQLPAKLFKIFNLVNDALLRYAVLSFKEDIGICLTKRHGKQKGNNRLGLFIEAGNRFGRCCYNVQMLGMKV